MSAPVTMMLRNIPVDVPLDVVVMWLNEEGFCGYYDIINLPRDSSTGKSMGYAFINFACPVVAHVFQRVFQRKALQGGELLKSGDVSYAKSQGFHANILRLQQSHNTKIFNIPSGEEVPMPRDSDSLVSLIESNRKASERIKSSTAWMLSMLPSIDCMKTFKSQLNGSPDTAVGSMQGKPPLQKGPNELSKYLIVDKASLSCLAPSDRELKMAEQLIKVRQHWEMHVVASPQDFSQELKELTEKASTENTGSVIAVLVSSECLSFDDQIVKDNFSLADAIVVLTSNLSSLENWTNAVPDSRCFSVANLFDLGNTLRQLTSGKERKSINPAGSSPQCAFVPKLQPAIVDNKQSIEVDNFKFPAQSKDMLTVDGFPLPRTLLVVRPPPVQQPSSSLYDEVPVGSTVTVHSVDESRNIVRCTVRDGSAFKNIPLETTNYFQYMALQRQKKMSHEFRQQQQHQLLYQAMQQAQVMMNEPQQPTTISLVDETMTSEEANAAATSLAAALVGQFWNSSHQ